MNKFSLGALCIIQGNGRHPSISDSRRLDAMPIRVLVCVTLYIPETVRVAEMILTSSFTIGLK